MKQLKTMMKTVHLIVNNNYCKIYKIVKNL